MLIWTTPLRQACRDELNVHMLCLLLSSGAKGLNAQYTTGCWCHHDVSTPPQHAQLHQVDPTCTDSAARHAAGMSQCAVKVPPGRHRCRQQQAAACMCAPCGGQGGPLATLPQARKRRTRGGTAGLKPAAKQHVRAHVPVRDISARHVAWCH
jgi:hypothetical protein